MEIKKVAGGEDASPPPARERLESRHPECTTAQLWCLLTLLDEGAAIGRAARRLAEVAPDPDLAEIEIGAAQIRLYTRRLYTQLQERAP